MAAQGDRFAGRLGPRASSPPRRRERERETEERDEEGWQQQHHHHRHGHREHQQRRPRHEHHQQHHREEPSRRENRGNLPEDLQDYDPYFVFSLTNPPHLIHTPLAEILEGYGLKETPIARDMRLRPAIVWAEPQEKLAFDKRLYYIHCGVKNVLTNDKFVVARKDQLVKNFRERGLQRYLPPTFVCEPTDSLENIYAAIEIACGKIEAEDVLIFRPSECYSGMGITTLRAPSPDDARRAVEHGRAEGFKLTHRPSPVLISRYITNLALWRGRKFHMRVYFLVSVVRGTLRSYVWEQGKILAASKPYVHDHFDDAAIHDTHYRSTGGDFVFPKDLVSAEGGVSEETFARAWANLKQILVHVSEIYLPHAKVFDECKYGFEVFGLDVLMQASGEAVLLEVNDKIGYNYSTDEFRLRFSREFFAWVNATTLAPLLRGAPFPDPLFSAPVVAK
eukprot:m.29021 g.29021  ORF g.29021 m.29021 type:complete len:450 (+) comp9127_c0_seq1:1946-3295(+)